MDSLDPKIQRKVQAREDRRRLAQNKRRLG